MTTLQDFAKATIEAINDAEKRAAKPTAADLLKALTPRDAHEAMLILAWRKVCREQDPGWHFEFTLTMAGLSHINQVLRTKTILESSDVPELLANVIEQELADDKSNPRQPRSG